MKLVIDISEESYERIKYMYIHNNSTASDFKNIIEEGVPFVDYLAKLKTEVENSPYTKSYEHETEYIPKHRVYDIIDRLRKEGEQNG